MTAKDKYRNQARAIQKGSALSYTQALEWVELHWERIKEVKHEKNLKWSEAAVAVWKETDRD